MIDLNEVERQARAEVLAACIKAVHERWKKNNGFNEAGPVLADLEDDIRALQPAAKDLEANDDYVRKLRDMDWIREFPVVNEHWCPGFPEGVKPYLEALLRKERAEVLAACIKAADEHNSFNHDDGSPCSGYCGEIIASKIRSLRPAASEGKG
ncbi:hypothetical protein LCGC14_2513450 [marine sediment metagenome]|uniref:Uncharacterized protein n=1 Tax=marine sediment metagenome TaxID=412755 RepID=A0A0F9AYD5_9ZZZZ